jgi:nudix-type nucleoside diphosphatase (YffH/AdpP family)
MKPIITAVKAVHEGWTRFLLATTRLPDGAVATRAVLDHGRAVGVLAYDPTARRALLVAQYRVPMLYAGETSELLEAIAGRLEDEDAQAAVRREAMEEAGVDLRELEHVATCWPSPGIMTERITLFLAPYDRADRVERGGGAANEHENVRVEEVPLAELAALADRGQLADMKTFLLVQTLRLRRPDLFQS